MGWLFGQDRKCAARAGHRGVPGAAECARRCAPPTRRRWRASRHRLRRLPAAQAARAGRRHAGAHRRYRRGGAGRVRPMAMAAHRRCATLVEKLAEKGARSIAFDVVFAEPDRSSIDRVVQHPAARRADPRTAAARREVSRQRRGLCRGDQERAGRHRLRLRPQGRDQAAAPLRRLAHNSGERSGPGAGADRAIHPASRPAR